MSEQHKIDDLFKRNEAQLNRDPSDAAWNKLERMLPKEEEKAIAASPFEERVKSFEQPNPHLVKTLVPTWVRYAALLALFSIPIAAYFAIQFNGPIDQVLAESSKAEEQSTIVAMNDANAKSFAMEDIDMTDTGSGTDGAQASENERRLSESARENTSRKRFGNKEKIKSSNGNKGTGRPPVLTKPETTTPKPNPRFKKDTPLPNAPQANGDAVLPIEPNIAMVDDEQVEPDLVMMDDTSFEQDNSFEENEPPADETSSNEIFDRADANADSEIAMAEQWADSLMQETQLEEVVVASPPAAIAEAIEPPVENQSDIQASGYAISEEKVAGNVRSKRKEGAFADAVHSNSMAFTVHKKLDRYLGDWKDDSGLNRYNIISTGPNSASIDVYRSGKLSRNYQLVETADGIGLMLFDNEANQGTTEYLVQSIDDKLMQFFLPSDPTNLVRFEVKKKKLIVTEQKSTSETRTFKLKRIE